MRRLAFALAAILIAAAQPAEAQTRARSERVTPSGEIRIGVGHGIGFLPLYLASDLKLFDFADTPGAEDTESDHRNAPLMNLERSVRNCSNSELTFHSREGYNGR